MNKNILVCLMAIVTLAGTDALASRARVLTMGSGEGGLILGNNGDRGSFFYDDGYNIFFNPAEVNQFNNWGIIEKSNGNGQAEAGFISSVAALNVGLFFNRSTSLENGTFSGNMRPIDLLLGMEHDNLQWGLGVSYARANSANDALTARLGVNWMDLSVWGHYMVKGKTSAVGGGADVESMLLGADYVYGEWKLYAAYRRDANEVSGTDFATKTWGLGVARGSKIAEGVMLNYAFGWWKQNQSNYFPLDISVEGDATDWLTLRAGFTFMSVSTARLGSTFRIGELDLDWVVGNSNVTGGSASTENITSANFDVANGFFTAASVTYKW